jgi:hypothetical protein
MEGKAEPTFDWRLANNSNGGTGFRGVPACPKVKRSYQVNSSGIINKADPRDRDLLFE